MGFPPKLALVFIGFFGLCVIATSVPDTNVTTVLCNSGVYSKGDPFGTSLAYVLAEIEAVILTSKNYDYFNISPYPNAFAYGHGACNQNLTSSDCSTCLGAAKTAMFASCQSRIGARSVLHDCTISVSKLIRFNVLVLSLADKGSMEWPFLSSRLNGSELVDNFKGGDKTGIVLLNA
ncbi:hypothetical protein POTOM_019829 [Populus tomentosa]|uniref:Gnk2-homologous domain-containing protein n=1 Tax=Populus tomentosa TaxID=118781 RepID=A0A8X7ZSM1_POPTO|nr:hypothetical protein POTOM_019829 [Populus tomentosa]